jgi:thiazole synthase ThiGH ThiG subunit
VLRHHPRRALLAISQLWVLVEVATQGHKLRPEGVGCLCNLARLRRQGFRGLDYSRQGCVAGKYKWAGLQVLFDMMYLVV